MQVLAVNSTISCYRILSSIGAGGMGQVYLAEDTRLGRKVALKVLPAEFAADRDRLPRFEQEAKAASALNHPNIITIHAFDQSDNLHFIVSEFIEGRTLRQLMQSGTIQVAAGLDYAVQVASALAAAHEAGIVHRDIKPENIMVRSDGIVKVLDFGLAKLTELQPYVSDTKSPTIARVDTEPGTIMGTASYMSPEQARGQNVDARTDVFSFGAVLYEMIAGCAPFEGETTSDIIASILKTDPPPLSLSSPESPGELHRIVGKSLRKDREQRYQTARDLLIDLKNLRDDLGFETRLKRETPTAPAGDGNRGLDTVVESPINSPVSEARQISSASAAVAGMSRRRITVVGALVLMVFVVASIVYFRGTSTQPIDSIAVLPFVNAGTDANAEYLSDGITETIINSLAQLPNLRVMSRNSVFRFKGRESAVESAARELSVRAVLVGRVARRGDLLQISAELLDARDGRHLWGEQYNRAPGDILAVQDEIANRISQRLRLKLTGEDQRRLTKRYTNSTEAYELYLKGRHHYLKFDSDEIRKGIEYFSEAVAIDQNYALAYAALAEAHFANTNFPIDPREPMTKARSAATRALEIDDTLAEAYVPLALVEAYYDRDWVRAERDMRRAVELGPANAWTRDWFGWLLLSMARYDEGLAEARRAAELDPLASPIVWDLGLHLFVARDYDAAMAHFDKAIELDPSLASPYLFKGLAYEQQGHLDAAIISLKKAHEMDPNMMSYGSLGHAYGRAKRREEAEAILQKMKELSATRFVSPSSFAIIYTGLGERDQAFEWFEKAYETRDPQLANWFKVDPRLESMRADPRGKDLLKRLGLAP